MDATTSTISEVPGHEAPAQVHTADSSPASAPAPAVSEAHSGPKTPAAPETSTKASSSESSPAAAPAPTTPELSSNIQTAESSATSAPGPSSQSKGFLDEAEAALQLAEVRRIALQTTMEKEIRNMVHASPGRTLQAWPPIRLPAVVGYNPSIVTERTIPIRAPAQSTVPSQGLSGHPIPASEERHHIELQLKELQSRYTQWRGRADRVQQRLPLIPEMEGLVARDDIDPYRAQLEAEMDARYQNELTALQRQNDRLLDKTVDLGVDKLELEGKMVLLTGLAITARHFVETRGRQHRMSVKALERLMDEAEGEGKEYLKGKGVDVDGDSGYGRGNGVGRSDEVEEEEWPSDGEDTDVESDARTMAMAGRSSNDGVIMGSMGPADVDGKDDDDEGRQDGGKAADVGEPSLISHFLRP